MSMSYGILAGTHGRDTSLDVDGEHAPSPFEDDRQVMAQVHKGFLLETDLHEVNAGLVGLVEQGGSAGKAFYGLHN